MLPGSRTCDHQEIPGIVEPYPSPYQQSSHLPKASLLEVTGIIGGSSPLFPLSSRLGIRVGRTRQPPLPPALPAPSLAGGRQLCHCSAQLPPPESPALKLPGCGQPRYHGNCILHPCRRLHLKAIGENRGTGETEEREKTGLATQPFLPCLALPPCSIPHRECQLPKPAPRPLQKQPPTQAQPRPTPTTWGPRPSPVEGGMELIKNLIDSLASNHFNTCRVLSKFRLRGKGEEQEEGRSANLQLRPTGKKGVYSCLCGLASRSPPNHPCSAPEQ